MPRLWKKHRAPLPPPPPALPPALYATPDNFSYAVDLFAPGHVELSRMPSLPGFARTHSNSRVVSAPAMSFKELGWGSRAPEQHKLLSPPKRVPPVPADAPPGRGAAHLRSRTPANVRHTVSGVPNRIVLSPLGATRYARPVTDLNVHFTPTASGELLPNFSSDELPEDHRIQLLRKLAGTPKRNATPKRSSTRLRPEKTLPDTPEETKSLTSVISDILVPPSIPSTIPESSTSRRSPLPQRRPPPASPTLSPPHPKARPESHPVFEPWVPMLQSSVGVDTCRLVLLPVTPARQQTVVPLPAPSLASLPKNVYGPLYIKLELGQGSGDPTDYVPLLLEASWIFSQHLEPRNYTIDDDDNSIGESMQHSAAGVMGVSCASSWNHTGPSTRDVTRVVDVSGANTTAPVEVVDVSDSESVVVLDVNDAFSRAASLRYLEFDDLATTPSVLVATRSIRTPHRPVRVVSVPLPEPPVLLLDVEGGHAGPAMEVSSGKVEHISSNEELEQSLQGRITDSVTPPANGMVQSRATAEDGATTRDGATAEDEVTAPVAKTTPPPARETTPPPHRLEFQQFTPPYPISIIQVHAADHPDLEEMELDVSLPTTTSYRSQLNMPHEFQPQEPVPRTRSPQPLIRTVSLDSASSWGREPHAPHALPRNLVVELPIVGDTVTPMLAPPKRTLRQSTAPRQPRKAPDLLRRVVLMVNPTTARAVLSPVYAPPPMHAPPQVNAPPPRVLIHTPPNERSLPERPAPPPSPVLSTSMDLDVTLVREDEPMMIKLIKMVPVPNLTPQLASPPPLPTFSNRRIVLHNPYVSKAWTAAGPLHNPPLPVLERHLRTVLMPPHSPPSEPMEEKPVPPVPAAAPASRSPRRRVMSLNFFHHPPPYSEAEPAQKVHATPYPLQQDLDKALPAPPPTVYPRERLLLMKQQEYERVKRLAYPRAVT